MGFACSFHDIHLNQLGESTPASKCQVHSWIDISEKVPYFGNVQLYSCLASVFVIFALWDTASCHSCSPILTPDQGQLITPKPSGSVSVPTHTVFLKYLSPLCVLMAEFRPVFRIFSGLGAYCGLSNRVIISEFN